MALVDDIRGFEAGLVKRMRASIEQVRIYAAKRRVYRRTFNELSALSQRDLNDLGIARANIPEIARTAAFGER